MAPAVHLNRRFDLVLSRSSHARQAGGLAEPGAVFHRKGIAMPFWKPHLTSVCFAFLFAGCNSILPEQPHPHQCLVRITTEAKATGKQVDAESLFNARSNDTLIDAVHEVLAELDENSLEVSALSVRALLWCLKIDYQESDTDLPAMTENGVFLVNYDLENDRRSALAYLQRSLTHPGNLSHWGPGLSYCLRNSRLDEYSVQDLTGRELSREIIPFVAQTDFGMNDWDADLKCEAIHAYMPLKKPDVRFLSEGIDAAEKRRRKNLFQRYFGQFRED
jgi:hypothetical protein